MEIEIIEDKNNPMLSRREIRFRAIHEGATPSREEVKTRLSTSLDASSDLLIIDYLRPEFGKAERLGYAKLYESEDMLRSIEREHIIERNTPKPKEKPAEKGEEVEPPEEAAEGSEEAEAPEAKPSEEASEEEGAEEPPSEDKVGKE